MTQEGLRIPTRIWEVQCILYQQGHELLTNLKPSMLFFSKYVLTFTLRILWFQCFLCFIHNICHSTTGHQIKLVDPVLRAKVLQLAGENERYVDRSRAGWTTREIMFQHCHCFFLPLTNWPIEGSGVFWTIFPEKVKKDSPRQTVVTWNLYQLTMDLSQCDQQSVRADALVGGQQIYT